MFLVCLIAARLAAALAAAIVALAAASAAKTTRRTIANFATATAAAAATLFDPHSSSARMRDRGFCGSKTVAYTTLKLMPANMKWFKFYSQRYSKTLFRVCAISNRLLFFF